MLSVAFTIPPGPPEYVRGLVQRVSGLVSGQVTFCVLDGPPLSARVSAAIPPERLARVQEVSTLMGVSCNVDP